MNRKAILISASGKEGEKGHLAGTKKDVHHLTQFLESNIGGAWEYNEIDSYNDPSYSTIKALKDAEHDFTLTLISGHGGIYKKDQNLYLEIDGIDYKKTDFINKSKRQLMVLDCCRSYFDEPLSEKMASFSLENASADTDLSRIFREAYCEEVSSADEGIIFLYSCAAGQAADEDPEHGAYFINSLIESGNVWAKNNYGSMDVYDALTAAKSVIKKYPTTQSPEISGSKRRKWFPFCVNP